MVDIPPEWLADGTYEAVFAFGVLHHLPDWRAGLAEVRRVLKPGGRLFAEESYAPFITHPVWRRLLHHPLEDRFDHAGLLAEPRTQHFRVRDQRRMGDGLGWLVADKAWSPPALAPLTASPGAKWARFRLCVWRDMGSILPMRHGALFGLCVCEGVEHAERGGCGGTGVRAGGGWRRGPGLGAGGRG